MQDKNLAESTFLPLPFLPVSLSLSCLSAGGEGGEGAGC